MHIRALLQRRLREQEEHVFCRHSDIIVGGTADRSRFDRILDVRRIHPGRCLDRAELRRNEARARYYPQARAHDGWGRDRDERAGQRINVYGAFAEHGVAH